MAEYIERKAALLMLTYHPLTDPDPLDLIPAVLRTARKAVAKIPAADVVEVVRCKDCKRMNEDKFCVAWEGFVRLDDFCSYGMRKENNND